MPVLRTPQQGEIWIYERRSKFICPVCGNDFGPGILPRGTRVKILPNNPSIRVRHGLGSTACGGIFQQPPGMVLVWQLPIGGVGMVFSYQLSPLG